MRIPWWLRNRNLVEIKRRVDQVVPDLIDRVDGLEKLPLHYQKAYMEGRTKEPRSVHYVPATKTHIYDAEHGKMYVYSGRKPWSYVESFNMRPIS